MNIFKGYVPTKNKQCLMGFRDADPDDLKTLDEVKDLEEYAGILSEDTILIDIDDSEQSKILYKIVEDLDLVCRVYKTTRGMHFIFNNISDDGKYLQDTCKTHTMLACGLEADIKVGHKNSYSVLKFKGKEREILYDKLDDEEYQQVPKYLLPVKGSLKFIRMDAGSGRNQALFNYILTLQSLEYTVEECRECIRIINKYILKDPLDDQEIETILRDDAFKKPVFFTKNGFQFEKFAVYMKNVDHVTKVHGQLHVYMDGVYAAGPKLLGHKMIEHIPQLKQYQRNEVYNYLDTLIVTDTQETDARYINFRNGILDIETGSLHEHSADYILTNKINYDYDPSAYSQLCDRTLDKISCNDPEIRRLLEEVAGYVLFRRNELRKAFILVGDKANGKSTFLDMIKTMLGDENTTALDLKELSERFKTTEAVSKLAIIGDDIGDEFIPNPAIFKKLVSGDRINVERKGQDPFDFNNYAKLLFSANSIPRIKDKTGAVIDRLIIVPFNARFSAADPDYDPYIKYKLRSDDSIKYLIRLGIEGLKRVLHNQCFSISEKIQREMEEYDKNNNPILLFFEEDPKIENEPTSVVYRKYCEFCVINTFTPMSNIEFSKQVKKHYGMDIVNRKVRDKKFRVFVKREVK